VPPEPISHDCIADLLGDREARSTTGAHHGFGDCPEMSPVHLDTIRLNGKEFSSTPQSHRLGDAS
jgi:hypothetical protein